MNTRRCPVQIIAAHRVGGVCRRQTRLRLPGWLGVAAVLAVAGAGHAHAQVVVRQVIVGGQGPVQVIGGALPGMPGQPQGPQPGQATADATPAGPAVYTIDGERLAGRPIALEDEHLLLPTDPPRRIALHDIDRVEFAGLPELKAQWLGQDGADYVQPGAAAGPNGVVDIHIRLTGLAVDTPAKQIVLACHNPLQRSVWRLDPTRTPSWKLHLEQSPGTDVADVYVEPDSQDAFGHEFTLTVIYQDNRTARTRFRAATHTSNVPPAGGPQPPGAVPPAEQPAAGLQVGERSAAVQPAPDQPAPDPSAVDQAAAEQPAAEQAAHSAASATPGGEQQDSQAVPSGMPGQAGVVMVHGQGPLKVRGQLVQMDETSLTLVTNWGQELSIPLSEVRALQWLGSSTPEARQKFEAALANPVSEDTLLVRGRDQAISLVQGTASAFADGRLQFSYEGTSGNIAQARLVGLVFARQPPRPEMREPFQLVLLATGDRLAGSWTALTEETLELTTGWGQRAVLPVSAIAQVQFRNGRLVYLSDLEPAQVEELGYFGRTFTHRRDQGLDGGPLRLAGQTYRKGVAVHARSVLTYELDGPYAMFRTFLGFADSAAAQGSVAVRVLGDGRELFSLADLRAVDAEGKRTAPVTIEVPLEGIKRLTLEVDFGEHEDVGDRLIWADARLYRALGDSQPSKGAHPP